MSFGKKHPDVSTKKWQISLDSAVHLVFLLARLCSTNYNVLSLVKIKASEQLEHSHFIPSNQGMQVLTCVALYSLPTGQILLR